MITHHFPKYVGMTQKRAIYHLDSTLKGMCTKFDKSPNMKVSRIKHTHQLLWEDRTYIKRRQFLMRRSGLHRTLCQTHSLPCFDALRHLWGWIFRLQVLLRCGIVLLAMNRVNTPIAIISPGKYFSQWGDSLCFSVGSWYLKTAWLVADD